MTGWNYNDTIEIKSKYGVITMPHNIHKALVTAITNTFSMPEGQVKAGFETVIKNQVKQLTQEHYESIANLFTQEPLKGYFRSLSGFGKFIVIIGQEVVGVHDSFIEAIEASRQKYEAGTFLVQECMPGEENYTQTFHSRVIFA